MNRDDALVIIKRHELELRRLGIASLSLFGSLARGEAQTHSDVDVAVQLENPPQGFAYFGRLGEIERRLAALLESPVDVIDEPAARPQLRQAIERDRCLAF